MATAPSSTMIAIAMRFAGSFGQLSVGGGALPSIKVLFVVEEPALHAAPPGIAATAKLDGVQLGGARVKRASRKPSINRQKCLKINLTRLRDDLSSWGG